MAKAPLLPRRRPRIPSATERLVGTGLLALLGVILVLFFAAGSRPGPLAQAEDAGEPGAPAPRMFDVDSPQRWPARDQARYDASTLFEKINGKADAYLAFDFVALHFASYVNEEPGESDYVDIYVYEMKTPLDAFGVYRSARTGREAAFEAGDEAVQRDEAVFFREGPYLVEVFASGPGAKEEARALAKELAERLAADTDPVEVPEGFEAKTLRIVQFARRSALGVEGLDDAFVALHDDGTKVVQATLRDETTAATVAARARGDLAFLGEAFTLERDGREVRVAVGGDEARREALLSGLRPTADEETR